MLTGASAIQIPKRSKVCHYHSLPRSKLFMPGLGLGELCSIIVMFQCSEFAMIMLQKVLLSYNEHLLALGA